MMGFDTFLAVASGGLCWGRFMRSWRRAGGGLDTLGIFNFAHGAFIALGAYIGWQIADAQAAGWGWRWAWRGRLWRCSLPVSCSN